MTKMLPQSSTSDQIEIFKLQLPCRHFFPSFSSLFLKGDEGVKGGDPFSNVRKLPKFVKITQNKFQIFKQEKFEKEIMGKVYNFLYYLVGGHLQHIFLQLCTRDI
jgi:hypothetical protein